MVSFRAAGDAAVLAEFGTEIDAALSQKVFALYRRVAAAGLPGMTACIPAFSTLLVQFDPLRTEGPQIIEELRRLVAVADDDASTGGSQWRIPVCYQPDLAPDLESAAEAVGLSVERFVAAHASRTYSVYMLGGFPGYPYLGDVDEAIRIPRRTSPRLRVEPGSVAIAGRLSAIYPMPTPGGWNLIGRTPIPIFDTQSSDPALLSPGDTVTFEPIGEREFHALHEMAAAGELDRSRFRVSTP